MSIQQPATSAAAHRRPQATKKPVGTLLARRGNRELTFTSAYCNKGVSLVLYAPYLFKRPAFARASGMRYFASNCPRPPWRQALSPNFVEPSVRQQSETSSVGTGCQLW